MKRRTTARARTRRLLAAASALVCAALLLFAPSPAPAATQIRLAGPTGAGPIAPDAAGRFAFPNIPLKRNAVNQFTVTATDDAGVTYEKKLSITQLSLDRIVVSKVTATPLPPERIVQLVNDGVIDLDDPTNFNVSIFQLVLTIGKKEFPIDIPVGVGKFEETGQEEISPKSDPGSGNSSPRIQDTEIVVFEQKVSPPGLPPISIPGVIVIEGAIKSLKEFYSVRLLLMNTSGIFTLSDVKATIEYPDGGLSSTLPQDGVIAYDDIVPGTGDEPGQKEREFIIRGDEIGKRRVRVSFGGFVTGPGIADDDPIPFNGAAETQVEVKGPPQFRVRLSHPARVTAGVTYELGVEITNAGDAAALYASLELDLGADAKLVDCVPGATPAADPTCTDADTPVVRNLSHLFPGDVVTEKFTVLPLVTGDVTSCIGVSDQNVTLEVLVGNIGCITGKLPAAVDTPNGEPTVSVLPFANAQGVSVQTPITLFFSERIQESTIGPAIQVFDGAGNGVAAASLRFIELRGKTVAIWQTGFPLNGNETYTVVVKDSVEDLQGNRLFNPWQSTFRTTSDTNDVDPPALTLSIEPGVDPAAVIPGQIVRANAYAADQGSGVERVELRIQDTDVPGDPFQLIDQKSVFDLAVQGPCIFAIDSSNLVPGHTYQLKATAFDKAGNAQDATLPVILLSTAAPPQIVLPPDPAQPVLNGISVPLTPVSVSPGVRKVELFLDAAATPFATLTVAPYQSFLPTLGLGVGPHAVRAVATDGLGQQATATFQFILAENPNEPVVTIAGVSDGARFVQGTKFSVSASAEDPVGVTGLRFALNDPNGPPLADNLGSLQIDTTVLGAGLNKLYAIATNALGVSNDPAKPESFLEFVVETPPNGPPPAAPQLATLAPPVAGQVAVSGNTGVPFARVDVTNATRGAVKTVSADALGVFSTTIEADPGDAISVIVFDFGTSQQPSTAAGAVVPAPPVLLSIAALPAATTFTSLGAAVDLVVTASYAGGATADVTSQTTFLSSAPAVAPVTPGGRVSALANGSATITASFGGQLATSAISVNAVVLQGIQVSPSSLAFATLNGTANLVVTGLYSNGSQQTLSTGLSFASSVPAVAAVNASGLVTARAGGSAQITVQRTGVPPVIVPVTVDPALDPAPTTQILSPANGFDVERGQLVTASTLSTDALGGVTRVVLTTTGASSTSEARQVVPPALSTSQSFSFTVAADAPIGGTITVSAQAEDTGGKTSPPATITLDVVDATDPAVSIQSPAPLDTFGYGDAIPLQISASDAVGVTQIRYQTSGVASLSGSQAVTPAQAFAGASFDLLVPNGPPNGDLLIQAFARDAAGNEGATGTVRVKLSGADLTPPATQVTAVGAPSGATVLVSYEVTDGLADLDHVQLFFRRNGTGTFSRYTNAAGGNADGRFAPQSGAQGTILFDSTRMGGDGAYEFFTVGVDLAGNREPSPGAATDPTADPGAAATIASGAAVTTITSDTEMVGTALDDRNLRIDGATVTLVGPHAFRNVELVNGAVLTHRKTTTTDAYALELSAWTVTVDATSRIDVTARGYLGGGKSGLGETAHTVGFAAGAGRASGGSHGGVGGRWSSAPAGEVPNPIYGNLVNPVDLGSGGGAWSGNGGDGGGRVLVGAINLVVDGAVRADGGLSSGSASGEGSGGSVNFTLRTLSGRGTVEADGGTTSGSNHVGGGGGRIAVRHLDVSTWASSRITASGGDGFYGDGADGTIVLLPEGQANPELVINGAGPSSTLTELLIPPGQSFDSITLQNGANVLASGPIVLTGRLALRGGARLTHPSGSEAGLRITAARVEIDATSAIDVTGRGYAGGGASGFGESGATLGGVQGAPRAHGGTHGGSGGRWASASENDPRVPYGDVRQPVTLGGGGGSWSGSGGAGGGAVRIVASDTVQVAGAIRANGAVSAGSASGEGAGGSIWITTSTLTGDGAIAADGGTTNGSNHTGGGGGRIAIEADVIDPLADFSGLRSMTARGGDGFYGDGAQGTVYLAIAGAPQGELLLDAGRTSDTWSVEAGMPPIGPGTTAAVGADTLTLDGQTAMPPAGGVAGVRLNPDIAQGETFAVATSDATTIRVVTPNENGVDFASVAGVGKRYAGVWRFGKVTLRGGTRFTPSDALTVDGALVLSERSVLSHADTTPTYEGGLELALGSLAIDATSAIDVTGRGYRGGNLSGLGETAQTVGLASGSTRASAGSHAGLGGRWASAPGDSAPNPVYGNPTEPLDLGSGGGAWSGDGGDGGGRVRVVAGAVQIDGAIRADGERSSGSASGNGAGGSVNLRAATLAGTGTISANGGNDANANHVGGGGGRIALRIAVSRTLDRANVRAVGGDGFYGDGGHGTVYFQDPGQAIGDIVIDGLGFVAPPDSTPLAVGLVPADLILRGGVRAVTSASGPVTVTGTLRLEGGATLTHPPVDTSCLRIQAKRLEIDTGSAIDVTGRGYRGGNQAGLGARGETLGGIAGAESAEGGSHGGQGGRWPSAGAATAGQPYGSPQQPDLLGAGGGAWGGAGGAGGGCVRVAASEAVAVDGAIRADGAVSTGSASGEGAGGSIWITTATIGGAGTISANGGTTGNGNHSGGGGGRVAVYASQVDPQADLVSQRRVTAYGGDGFYADGAPGTVYTEIANGPSQIVIDQGLATGTWGAEGGLPSLGPGTTAAVVASPPSLAVDGLTSLPPPGGLAGLRVNPDLSQDETFAILSNDATTIYVVTPNENGIAFASVAGVGKRYAGVWRYPNLRVRGGARLSLADPLRVDGALEITERSVLTHPETTTVYEAGLDVQAGSIAIDATSAIDVSGRGYLGGGRGAFGSFGTTLGLVQGVGGATGGAHGGLGGRWSSSSSPQLGVLYGNANDPLELGSGGGAWGGDGGDGGGRVRLRTNALQCGGAIRANGALSSGSASGEGSGGSVNVTTVTLDGACPISADGGTTGGGNHSGGGGGRVRLRVSGASTYPSASATARGGDGFYADGADGTVVIGP